MSKIFVRKYVVDVAVPPLAYAPAAMSLDKFRYVLMTQP